MIAPDRPDDLTPLLRLKQEADEALASAGYLWIRRPPEQPLAAARERFLALLDAFGDNVSRDPAGHAVQAAEIRARADPSFDGVYVGDAHSDQELPLHTDGSGDAERVVRILGMHCERQAARGGETVLCDPFAVLGDLTRAEVDALRAPWPRRRPHAGPDGSRFVERPILDETAGRPRFSYGHQRLLHGLEAIPDATERERRRTLLARLDALLRRAATELRLADGDSIVIDNFRLLHGRRRFVDVGDAGRRLLRVWVGESRAAGVRG